MSEDDGRSAIGSPQLGLFGARPAPVPRAGLVALAERLPPWLRLGTSSWTFPGWAGLVYEKRYRNQTAFARESLEEYAAHPLFRTVGIDRSYYGPLREHELARYAAQLPPGFRCTMKVWSGLTSRVLGGPGAAAAPGQFNPHFLDPARFAEDVAAPVEAAFRSQLGAFVLEIPPARGPVNPRGFADAVDRFLAAAPEGFRYSVELRDPRLLTDRYVGVLRRHGASHVFNYWTRMPELGAQLDLTGGPTADVTVARLMIPPGKRYADLKAAYDPFDRLVAPQPRMRADVVRLALECAETGSELYVIVNNKVEGSSPHTVRALAEQLADALG
ncbi:MAG: DUF72 domain-containing protein [Myxococcota bacterium]